MGGWVGGWKGRTAEALERDEVEGEIDRGEEEGPAVAVLEEVEEGEDNGVEDLDVVDLLGGWVNEWMNEWVGGWVYG